MGWSIAFGPRIDDRQGSEAHGRVKAGVGFTCMSCAACGEGDKRPPSTMLKVLVKPNHLILSLPFLKKRQSILLYLVTLAPPALGAVAHQGGRQCGQAHAAEGSRHGDVRPVVAVSKPSPREQ